MGQGDNSSIPILKAQMGVCLLTFRETVLESCEFTKSEKTWMGWREGQRNGQKPRQAEKQEEERGKSEMEMRVTQP